MVGRLLSFWDGICSGAMLNFQGVCFFVYYLHPAELYKILPLPFGFVVKSQNIVWFTKQDFTTNRWFEALSLIFVGVWALFHNSFKVPLRKKYTPEVEHSHWKNDDWKTTFLDGKISGAMLNFQGVTVAKVVTIHPKFLGQVWSSWRVFGPGVQPLSCDAPRFSWRSSRTPSPFTIKLQCLAKRFTTWYLWRVQEGTRLEKGMCPLHRYKKVTTHP